MYLCEGYRILILPCEGRDILDPPVFYTPVLCHVLNS